LLNVPVHNGRSFLDFRRGGEGDGLFEGDRARDVAHVEAVGWEFSEVPGIGVFEIAFRWFDLGIGGGSTFAADDGDVIEGNVFDLVFGDSHDEGGVGAVVHCDIAEGDVV